MNAELIGALGELTAGGALIVLGFFMLVMIGRMWKAQNRTTDKLIDMLDEKTEPKRLKSR